MKRIAYLFLAITLGMVFWSAQAFAQNSAQEFFERGNQLYNNKKFSEAVSAYHKAIQLAPKSQEKAYLNCARAYYMQKDYVQAKRYYQFHFDLVPTASKDRGIRDEFNAVDKRAVKLPSYQMPESQRMVLDELKASLKKGGPVLTTQNGGSLAYYDVLLRTGFAEPELHDLQKKLAQALLQEIWSEITPGQGLVLAPLDRIGWEHVRQKIQRLAQFKDVEMDNGLIQRLEKTATGWETYYRGDFLHAAASFREASEMETPILAAYWGRVMASLYTQTPETTMAAIDECEKAYDKAKHAGIRPYLNVIRASVYSNMGKVEESIRLLETL